jgi:predicted RNA-binding Zn ribbon-like protein
MAARAKQKDEAATPPSRAGRLPLAGGALCLDFTNTASGRASVLHLEHLHRFEHLLAWARHAGAIDDAAFRTFAAAVERAPAAAIRAVRAARQLREALYAIFHAIARGAPPPAAPLATLNRALKPALAVAVLAPAPDRSGRRLAWQCADGTARPERLLWPVLRSATELLTGPGLERIKICPGHGCGWLFLDRTRNGRRRWCEMEVCGSRAKMRRYHQRRRLASAGR